MSDKDLKDEVRRLIGQDKLEESINLLSLHVQNSELLDDLIIQLARYNRVNSAYLKGSVPLQDLNMVLNGLVSNILAFLRRDVIIEEELEQENSKDLLKSFRAEMALSITRTKLRDLLLKSYLKNEAISIGEMEEECQLESRALLIKFKNELESLDLLDRIDGNGVVLWILNQKGFRTLDQIK